MSRDEVLHNGNGIGKNILKRKPTTPIDPLSVTESLGFQTFRRETRRPWTKEEDEQLTRVVMELHPGPTKGTTSVLTGEEVKWDVVASYFSETSQRKPKDCRKRWCNSLDPNLIKGKWTAEEDSKLKEAFQKYGASWKKVATEIRGRTDDQCAKRYIEVLDPKTKDRLKPWTHEEDLLLIRRVKIHGTKWKTIASEIEGRPSLTCRNRWRKIVTDVVRDKASAAVKEEVDSITHGESMDTDGTASIKSTPVSSEGLPKYDGVRKDLLDKQKQNIGHDNTMLLRQNSHVLSPGNQAPLQHHQSQMPTFQQVKSNQYDQIQNPAPRIVKKPVQSEINWKYTINNPPPNGNSTSRGEVLQEGNIANEELVQYLISYAKSNGLNVTVHQHIHHHYLPPSTTPSQQVPPNPYSGQIRQQASYKQPHQNAHSQQQSQLYSPYNPSANLSDTSTGFYVEPETQVNRYQHFNYLPPLTEVPKLNSSASSPTSSKEGQTMHHHYHHYQQPKPTAVSSSSNVEKESDLLRLLNGRSQTSSPQGAGSGALQRGPSPIPNVTNPLTPLAQAVELAAEVEEHGKNKRSNIQQQEQEAQAQIQHQNNYNNTLKRASQQVAETSPKRHKFEEEDEEGMDFWETMRNLTRLPEQQKSVTPALEPTTSNLGIADRKPVSQHHPLHHTNGSTPMPVENDQAEDEDLDVDADAYGLFYKVYTRENSAPIGNNDPSAYDSLANSFGMIPFNPS